MKSKNPSLLVIFLSVFIDLIGFGIVMPLLPIYTKRFGASGLESGLIIASFSAMQFLFSPMWGRLSDRIGRRPVILVSNFGSTMSYALFALASTMTGTTGLVMLMVSRVFAGICGANLSVANAYIADITPPEKRTQKMGMVIGMAFGLGFIFGPALGAFSFHHLGLAGPGWVAAGICGFNFLLGAAVLVESWKPTADHVPARPGLQQWVGTLRRPVVGLVIGVYFLATFCFACFESTFSLLVKDKFHYNESQAGYLFAYCGILAVFIQGGLIGRLNKVFGEKKLIGLSLILVAISLFLLPIVATLGTLMVSLAIFATGSGVNRPPTFGLISMKTAAHEQGAVLGVAQSMASLARVFGPIVANVLYAIRPSAPYMVCAAVSLAAGILSLVYLCRPDSTLPDSDVRAADGVASA